MVFITPLTQRRNLEISSAVATPVEDLGCRDHFSVVPQITPLACCLFQFNSVQQILYLPHLQYSRLCLGGHIYLHQQQAFIEHLLCAWPRSRCSGVSSVTVSACDCCAEKHCPLTLSAPVFLWVGDFLEEPSCPAAQAPLSPPTASPQAHWEEGAPWGTRSPLSHPPQCC